MKNVSEQVAKLSDKFWEESMKVYSEIRDKTVQDYIGKY